MINFGLQDVEVKAQGETGLVTGYGSVFGVKDLGGDVVESGAFTASLIKRMPRMLYSHDSRDIVGKWTSAEQDGVGLRLSGKLSLGVNKAREVYELLKDGALDGLSIGFRTVKEQWNSTEKARRILEAELFEVSFVGQPMNEAARVTGVKSSETPTVRELERELRAIGLTAQQAKAFCAGGYKATFGQRDADPSEAIQTLRASAQGIQKLFKGVSHHG